MKIKILWGFLSAIVGALIVMPAMAADLRAPMLKAPPPPVASWTGCYVAGGAGYGLYDIDHNVTSPLAGGAIFDPGHDNGGRGWFGTVGGGCDYEFASPLGGSGLFGGSWVIGILGDVDFMNIKGNYSYLCPAGCIGADGYFGQLTESSAGYIGGRIGWVVTPQLLTYFDAGWTETRFDSATLIGNPGALIGGTMVSLPAQTFNGYFIGGGTEYAINWLPGLFWRSEYRFSTYQGRSVAAACVVGGCNTAPGVNAIDNAKPYVQTVRSELIWRFNWGGAPVMSRY